MRERGGKRRLRAGLPSDRVGAQGVRWFTTEADARASPLVGAAPLVIDAHAAAPHRPGVLLLDPGAAQQLFGAAGAPAVALPGGVAVVVSP